MEYNTPVLDRWEKLSKLVSEVIQSEEFRDELTNATITQKLDLLITRYGFTDEELSMLDKDLKMLSDMSVNVAFRWY